MKSGFYFNMIFFPIFEKLCAKLFVPK